MTVTIPKWLVLTIIGFVAAGGVAVGGYLLGRSSDDSDTSSRVSVETDVENDAGTVPPPECSKNEARAAVASTEFESFVRELGAVTLGEPLFGRGNYVVGNLTCRDVTGDDDDEMVVQLVCCTGGSSSPWAIFVAEDGNWELAFHRDNIQAQLSVEGDEIVEKSPAYSSDDPTCCPSSFRSGRVTWDGDEFVFHSDEGLAKRKIKAGTRGVTRVGGFQPQTGSPHDATQAFGPPSYIVPDAEVCVNEWRDLGLVINFADLGGADPCSDSGRVGSIELRGIFAAQAGWETDEGVEVGMKARDLRAIYPDAPQQSFPGLRDALVLIEGPTVVGEGGSYPVLSAQIKDTLVEELRMSVGAAGD